MSSAAVMIGALRVNNEEMKASLNDICMEFHETYNVTQCHIPSFTETVLVLHESNVFKINIFRHN